MMLTNKMAVVTSSCILTLGVRVPAPFEILQIINSLPISPVNNQFQGMLETICWAFLQICISSFLEPAPVSCLAHSFSEQETKCRFCLTRGMITSLRSREQVVNGEGPAWDGHPLFCSFLHFVALVEGMQRQVTAGSGTATIDCDVPSQLVRMAELQGRRCWRPPANHGVTIMQVNCRLCTGDINCYLV